MISAVNAKGHLRFMAFEGKMNSDKFIEFLKRLIYKAARPIFLILDGHPVHKSKNVQDFVAKTKGKLRLFILPPYSPHLNPDEWVWNWLKRHHLGKTYISGPNQFRQTPAQQAADREHDREYQHPTEPHLHFFRTYPAIRNVTDRRAEVQRSPDRNDQRSY